MKSNDELINASEIYYLDPQASGVGVNLVNRIVKHPNFAKLMFLKRLFDQGQIRPLIYCGSSLPLFKIKIPVLVNRLISFLEFLIWKKHNKVKGKVFFSVSKSNKRKIIIVDSNTEFRNKYDFLKNLQKEKNVQFLFYTTHLHDRTNDKLNLFQQFPDALFFSESFPDISKEILKGIINNQNFILCPYVIKDYFMRCASPDSNENISNKILVVGTIVRSDAKFEKHLLENFRVKLIHPLRVELFDKKNEIKKVFHNVAAEYTADRKGSEYFKLDMTKVYTQYKYFICPEDAIGMPSGNMVEGMALGSIYFGNENYNYLKDYGMKPWVHYIPHNGTIDGIEASYHIIESNDDLYNSIRHNGMNFAVKNFNMDKVLETFIFNIKKKLA